MELFNDSTINLDSFKFSCTDFDKFWVKSLSLDNVEVYELRKLIDKKVKNPKLIGVFYKKDIPAYLLKSASDVQYLIPVDNYMLSIYNSKIDFKDNFASKPCRINYKEIVVPEGKKQANPHIKGKVKFMVDDNKIVVVKDEDIVKRKRKRKRKSKNNWTDANSENRYLMLMQKKMLN